MKMSVAPIHLPVLRTVDTLGAGFTSSTFPRVRAIVALLALCAISGFLVATQPLSTWVLILFVLAVAWALVRVVLNSSNPAWSVLVLFAMVIVASGNLDPRSAGINIPIFSAKEWLLAAGFVLACGGRLAADLLQHRQVRLPSLLWLVVLYSAAVSISAALADEPVSVWSILWTLLPMVAFVAGLWCYRSAEDTAMMLVAGCCIAGLSALSGIAQAVSPGFFSDLVYPFFTSDYQVSMANAVGQLGRYTSVWGQPTPFAMLLSMFLPGFGLIARRFHGLRRLLVVAGLGVTVVALFLTGARTAMLAGAIGLIVAEWSLLGRRKRVAIPVVVGGLAAAVLLAASALPESPLTGLFDGLSAFFFRSGEGFDPSFISRSEIYGAVGSVWLQHPVFGSGPGTAAEAVRSVQTYNSTGHSFWLQQLAEVGAFGVICYLSLLLTVVVIFMRSIKKIVGFRSQLSKVVAGMSLALILQSFADNSLLIWQFSSIFWMLQGAMIAMVRYGADEERVAQ